MWPLKEAPNGQHRFNETEELMGAEGSHTTAFLQMPFDPNQANGFYPFDLAFCRASKPLCGQM